MNTMILRTISESLDMAVEKNEFYNSIEQMNGTNYEWHIGIESESIPMFDIDRKVHISKVLKFANILKLSIAIQFKADNNVMVIETQNGYHVVSNAVLTEEQWLLLNKTILDLVNHGNEYVCDLDVGHLELNVKYEKTTLRISNKYKDEIYRVRGIV